MVRPDRFRPLCTAGTCRCECSTCAVKLDSSQPWSGLTAPTTVRLDSPDQYAPICTQCTPPVFLVGAISSSLRLPASCPSSPSSAAFCALSWHGASEQHTRKHPSNTPNRCQPNAIDDSTESQVGSERGFRASLSPTPCILFLLACLWLMLLAWLRLVVGRWLQHLFLDLLGRLLRGTVSATGTC